MFLKVLHVLVTALFSTDMGLLHNSSWLGRVQVKVLRSIDCVLSTSLKYC